MATAGQVSPQIMEEFGDIVGTDANCHRYRPLRHIGGGASSVVWQVTEVSTGRVLVGKFMDTTAMSEKSRSFALAEANNASKVMHPNIIEFVECAERNGKLLLVFEFADAGDLHAQVSARAPNRFFKEPEILLIMSQVCLAVSQLHKHKILHRDLKTMNVFLTMSGLIKLGDFGFSREYEQTVSATPGSTFCGTPYYLAPELWNQAPYGKKADMYSLGVILYELMSLRVPFSGASMKELVSNVLAGQVDPLPEQFSPELRGLCFDLLSVDPERRPTVQDVFARPVMRELGLMALLRNVPRLATVPAETRNRIVADVEAELREVDARAAAAAAGQPYESPVTGANDLPA